MRYQAARDPAGRPRGQGIRVRLQPRLGGEGAVCCRASGSCIAESYERIHRSNLVGMGDPALCSSPTASPPSSLGLTAPRPSTSRACPPRIAIRVRAAGATCGSGRGAPTEKERTFTATIRIDTPQEILYYRHGGILPYVLRQLLLGRERLETAPPLRHAAAAAGAGDTRPRRSNDSFPASDVPSH